jgi:hypothetical protein
MASKYDQETKDRVVRMFEERRSEAPEETQTASYRRLHELTHSRGHHAWLGDAGAGRCRSEAGHDDRRA